jgi:putative endonuclease
LRAKRSNPGATEKLIASELKLLTTPTERSDETALRLHHGEPPQRNTLYRSASNLPKRAFEHREGLVAGFSKKHACKILVWYELHGSMVEAITREKQIKAGSRAKKLALIESLNPSWKDLYGDLI